MKPIQFLMVCGFALIVGTFVASMLTHHRYDHPLIMGALVGLLSFWIGCWTVNDD